MGYLFTRLPPASTLTLLRHVNVVRGNAERRHADGELIDCDGITGELCNYAERKKKTQQR